MACFREHAGAPVSSVCVYVWASSQRPGLGVLIAGKGGSFEHCLAEADSLIEQSMRLEQAGDTATALALSHHAVCK